MGKALERVYREGLGRPGKEGVWGRPGREGVCGRVCVVLLFITTSETMFSFLIRLPVGL